MFDFSALSHRLSSFFSSQLLCLKLLRRYSCLTVLLSLSFFEVISELIVIFVLSNVATHTSYLFRLPLLYFLLPVSFFILFILRWKCRKQLHISLSLFELSLSTRVLSSLLSLRTFSSHSDSKECFTLLTNGITTFVGRGIVAFLAFLNSILLAIGFSIISAIYYPSLLSLLFPLLIIFAFILKRNRRLMSVRARSISIGLRETNIFLNDIYNSRRDILLFNCENQAYSDFQQISNQSREASWLSTAESIIPKYILELLMFLSMLALILFQSNVNITPSSLAVLGLVVLKLVSNLSAIARNFAVVQSVSSIGSHITHALSPQDI